MARSQTDPWLDRSNATPRQGGGSGFSRPPYASPWNHAVMGTDATRLDRVLAAEHATDADLAALDLAEVRHRRTEADREENDLSYLRRLLHGRLDIIRAEQNRRLEGSRDASPDTTPPPGSTAQPATTPQPTSQTKPPSTLVTRLAAILADPPPAQARSARHLEVDPGAEPGEYRARLEAVLAESDLSSVLESTDADLAAAREVFARHEREVSAYRGRVQRVEDRFADELTRRYREGQATVDAVLTEELLLNGEQRME